MPILLVISSSPEIIEKVTPVLPSRVRLVHVESVADTQSVQTNDEPLVILLDASESCTPATSCEMLKARFPLQTPLLVLLNDLTNREAVFEAGVQETLLSPLCQVELSTRLKNCFQMLELADEQEKLQTHAAQMAYILLISRLIDERLDLPGILAQTLEQTAGLLNAVGAEIWLLDEQSQSYQLASSLRSTSLGLLRGNQNCCSQDMIDWMAEQSQSVTVANLDDFVHEDLPKKFQPNDHLMLVNLRNKGRQCGVLLLCKDPADPFGPQDSLFMENISSLITATIVSSKIMDQLRRYAERQRIIQEMSHQIVPELDLELTLNRAIQWLLRISGMEGGIIWLADDRETTLESAAHFGCDHLDQVLTLDIPKNLKTKPGMFMVDPLSNFPCFEPYGQIFHFAIKNMVYLSMLNRGRLIGAVTLFNRWSGEPGMEDMQLLVTAVEMIAISVSNSLLHTRLVQLLDERERMHQQAMQDERLRTIGRLTASLAHEINNPMQAIRGALDLAMEERYQPQELEEYLQLGIRESDRVIRLVSRMRQLYRPPNDRSETVNLVFVLEDVLETGRKELERQRVTSSLQVPGDYLMMSGILNQLHLIFLSILLNLCDALGRKGGGKILIAVYDEENQVRVDFSTHNGLETIRSEDAPDPSPNPVTTDQEDTQLLSGLSLTYDILKANQGQMRIIQDNTLTIFRVELAKT